MHSFVVNITPVPLVAGIFRARSTPDRPGGERPKPHGRRPGGPGEAGGRRSCPRRGAAARVTCAASFPDPLLSSQPHRRSCPWLQRTCRTRRRRARRAPSPASSRPCRRGYRFPSSSSPPAPSPRWAIHWASSSRTNNVPGPSGRSATSPAPGCRTLESFVSRNFPRRESSQTRRLESSPV